LKALHSRTHRGEVYAERHSGEILKENTSYNEGNLRGALTVGLPCGELANVSLLDSSAIAVSKDRLKDNSNGNRES
jgi:hypothetical protein